MANAKILKEYLVDENNGYLLNDNNNGKVIMLSGKWGSGKTHFWKKIIATDELKKELSIKNSAYSYVSLYGKSSIEEIENDIFAQLYFSAIGGENIVTQKVSTFTKYTKRYGSIFSEKIEKFANGVKEEQKDNQERIALERLKNGAIICFDDFERKSKDIDLNDLFGFITQLTLNFDCKVVIILNDDVFKGEEKDVFSKVKEKSVSKFLKYEPKIEELFDLIFELEIEKDNKKEKKYKNLEPYKQIILKTIGETGELNARIYIQVLDNLVEWIEKEQDKDGKILRCLILVNINFILFHTILCREKPKNKKMNFYIHGIDKLKNWEFDYFLINFFGMPMVDLDYVVDNMENADVKHPENFEKYVIRLKDKKINKKDISEEKVKEIKKFIEDNLILFKSDYFANKLDISKNISDETFQKINNFIETGILINE